MWSHVVNMPKCILCPETAHVKCKVNIPLTSDIIWTIYDKKNDSCEKNNYENETICAMCEKEKKNNDALNIKNIWS